MTASEPPGEQPPEDDTALLTAALDHAWTWYDGPSSRVIQVINYYIVATAIVVTAYASAINDKRYGFAVALTTHRTRAHSSSVCVALYEVNAAGLAEPALTEKCKNGSATG